LEGIDMRNQYIRSRVGLITSIAIAGLGLSTTASAFVEDKEIVRVSRSGMPSGLDPSRIVNGVPTSLEPTVGGLQWSALPAQCSGTLIGCQTFLTAAHCVCEEAGTTFEECTQADPSALEVYLQHAGIFDVSSVDIHPSYDYTTSSDIAVLTLATPVTRVVPSRLNTTQSPPHGTPGTIVGFGRTTQTKGDRGIKRTGAIETAACSPSISEPAHVCWRFEKPIGPPGVDSSSCNGDSGGPLFMDLGDGVVVAGVGSGLTVEILTPDLCAAPNSSHDSNVFENTAFIEGIGGNDLLQTECGGAVSHVGDAEATIFEFSGAIDYPDAAELKCRKAVRKTSAKYTKAVLVAMQKCIASVNAGKSPGPCPDGEAAGKIDKAAAKVAPDKLAKKCGPGVLETAALGGGCSGIVDIGALSSCILDESDAVAESLIASEHAVAEAMIADGDARKCQAALAKAAGKYALARHKTLAKCHGIEDKAKVTSCPDAKATEKLVGARSKLEAVVAGKCSDGNIAHLAAIGAFGGSCNAVASVDGIVGCIADDHGGDTELLLALVDDVAGRAAFTVSENAVLVRVGLNHELFRTKVHEDPNRFYLHVSEGEPATEAHAGSTISVGERHFYQFYEVTDPVPGTWHALVAPQTGLGEYQLVVTVFE
jgi:hypothetical protein